MNAIEKLGLLLILGVLLGVSMGVADKLGMADSAAKTFVFTFYAVGAVIFIFAGNKETTNE